MMLPGRLLEMACPKPESTARGTRVQPAGPLPGGQSMKISEMKAKNLANVASILCKLLLLSSSLPKESHQALFKLCCRIEPHDLCIQRSMCQAC